MLSVGCDYLEITMRFFSRRKKIGNFLPFLPPFPEVSRKVFLREGNGSPPIRVAVFGNCRKESPPKRVVNKKTCGKPAGTGKEGKPTGTKGNEGKKLPSFFS